jgi:DNA repair exonuclease SbcCD ATPase subunit
MGCNVNKNNLILYLYDELDQRERQTLERHLSECNNCKQRLEAYKQTLSLVEKKQNKVPELDWDKNWRVVQERLKTKKTPQKITTLHGGPRKWAIASAAAAAIFLLGVFVGKFMLFPPQHLETGQFENQPFLASLFTRYVDEALPVIMEIANYDTRIDTYPDRLSESREVSHLLLQNRLLKKHMDSDGQRKLLQLLEELELVLTEISNLTSNDPDALESLKNLIQERQILFKIKYMAPRPQIRESI